MGCKLILTFLLLKSKEKSNPLFFFSYFVSSSCRWILSEVINYKSNVTPPSRQATIKHYLNVLTCCREKVCWMGGDCEAQTCLISLRCSVTSRRYAAASLSPSQSLRGLTGVWMVPQLSTCAWMAGDERDREARVHWLKNVTQVAA